MAQRRSKREIKKTKLESLFCYDSAAAEGATQEAQDALNDTDDSNNGQKTSFKKK